MYVCIRTFVSISIFIFILIYYIFEVDKYEASMIIHMYIQLYTYYTYMLLLPFYMCSLVFGVC